MIGKVKTAIFGLGLASTLAMSGVTSSANAYDGSLRTPIGNNMMTVEGNSYGSSIKLFSIDKGRENWSQTFPGSKVKFQPVFSLNGKYAALVTENDSCLELRVVSLDIGRENWVEHFPGAKINQTPGFTYTPNGEILTVISNGGSGASINTFSVETGIKR